LQLGSKSFFNCAHRQIWSKPCYHGDYSLRVNNRDVEGAISDFNELLNKMPAQLAKQSLITREQQILLTKVRGQIDAAIVATDQNNAISLMNLAAERLFKKRFESIQGWPIKTIGLQGITG
jgi:nitrogen fixation/metabolism regulation signal transduction histidine kinase